MPTDPPARLGADRPAPLGFSVRCPECVPGTQSRPGPRLLHVRSYSKRVSLSVVFKSGLSLFYLGVAGKFCVLGHRAGAGCPLSPLIVVTEKRDGTPQVRSVAHGPAPILIKSLRPRRMRMGCVLERSGVRSWDRLQPCGCGYPLPPSLPLHCAQTMGVECAYPRRHGSERGF